MTGTILGNRYTIQEALGSGGMANVYKAHCAYLQRDVAIKVLKEEYRADADLIKRFDSEARAAASLTHPNIVQIYDVGKEEGVNYIVMELVEGRSLKELIEENGPMPWKLATEVVAKVASALNKAHGKGIVHRDIKPQNILMTDDGEPKVADFGIARTASTGMETMKVDTVASVHYASPEQVRGGYTDAQSDLYSVGVTLYEMLTGKLPYSGENPVSVALRHIQDRVPRADADNHDIPAALADIVARCMQKNRADRYPDAATLLADLDVVRRDPAAVLPVPVAKSAVVVAASGQVPEASAGALEPVAATDIERARRPVAEVVWDDAPVRGQSEQYIAPRSGIMLNGRVFNPKKLIFPLLYLVLIGIIIALIVNIVDFIRRDLSTPSPTAVVQRDVVLGSYSGRPINEVLAEIDEANIPPSQVEVRYQYDNNVPENTVIGQNPLAGSKLILGGLTTLEIIVSKGQDMVVIPDIRNMKRSEMWFELSDKFGLDVQQVAEYHDDLEVDRVIRLDPEPGTEVARGTPIVLYWSLGKEMVQVPMPDLKGLDRQTAEARLSSNRLMLGSILPAGVDTTLGVVSAQSVRPGDLIPEGTSIDLTFEVPPEEVDDPIPVETDPADPEEPVETPAPTEPGPIQTKGSVVIKWPAEMEADSAQVVVATRNKTTGVEDLLLDMELMRDEFPYTQLVEIPEGEKITVLVYLNGTLLIQEDF